MKAQLGSAPTPAPKTPAHSGRRRRITAATMAATLLCCGATSCTKTQVALSTAGIAAAVVGVTVGVTLAIQHSHHTLEGCIYSDANGLKLRTNDARVFSIKGETANVKVGEKLKLHGSKVKRGRHETEDQVFVVERVNKDQGACQASTLTAPSPAK